MIAFAAVPPWLPANISVPHTTQNTAQSERRRHLGLWLSSLATGSAEVGLPKAKETNRIAWMTASHERRPCKRINFG